MDLTSHHEPTRSQEFVAGSRCTCSIWKHARLSQQMDVHSMLPSFLSVPIRLMCSNFTALWNVQLFYTILKYIEYGLETSTQMINTAAEISFVTLMSNHVKMPADLKHTLHHIAI